jgi:hypothetical protein
MPRFDGTGPQGQGSLTGRGRGYCAQVLPSPGTGKAPYGYAGVRGTPVRLRAPATPLALGRRFARWLRPATRLGRAFGRGRGRGAGRGRGRRFGRL